MNLLRPLLVLTLFNILSGCGNNNEVHILPMSTILAVPEKYIYKDVHVVGYLHASRGILYMTRDHAIIDDRAASLTLDYAALAEPAHCREKYVNVRGTLALIQFGQSVRELGLTDIKMMVLMPSLKPCVDVNN